MFAVEKEEGRIVSSDKRRAQEKLLQRLESESKEAATKMNGLRFKSNILMAVLFFFLYRYVAGAWDGISVATLPFHPANFVASLSHRGIAGDNLRECSFGFIYTLCTMGLKQNIPKLLGFTQPRSGYSALRAAKRAADETAKDL